MGMIERLTQLIQAEAMLTVLVTREEERALAMLRAAMASAMSGSDAGAWKVVEWNCMSGWDDETREQGGKPPPNPREALARIQKGEADLAVYVLKDTVFLLKNDPVYVRGLRNIVMQGEARRKRVVLLQTAGFLPPELSEYAVVEELPLPTPEELDAQIFLRKRVDADLSGALSQSMKGLTMPRAEQALRTAVVAGRGLNEDAVACVMQEKQQLLSQSEALCYMEASDMGAVGGLSKFKKWLNDQRVAFTDYGRENGAKPPRGVLLAGIPGTGKSLAAKSAASVLALPLVRLDISRIFRSYVGESENTCAHTLKLLDSLAPCVCLIDEMDKVFASAASTDSGTSARVLGQVLHYMQEDAEGVFIVATCNHVERLPPELIRKGRFADEIFFVDLPGTQEREEILQIHVEKYLSKLGHSPLSLATFASMTEGFTGAELEHVVKKALIAALGEQRPVEPGDLTRAIYAEIPQSQSMSEAILEMRELVTEGRYMSAG